MEQQILSAEDNYREFDEWLSETKAHKVMVVCDDSLKYMDVFQSHLDKLNGQNLRFVFFRDFSPNPLYNSVIKGVELFRDEVCSAIIAIGGGSSMDVAKCIKLYANFPGDGMDGSWLSAHEKPRPIPFLAMPTTAGTGSEATRYAVVYYNDIKQSITNDALIPEAVLMDPDVLKTLPVYQKKSTMCDALCHAIESFWSVNSTEESLEYSRKAIEGIMASMHGYLAGSDEGNAGMLMAAHLAGKAINITQTTAGHAMCYKITSLFHCSHGHAAILCDRILFPWMIDNTDGCIDKRGETHLKDTLDRIGKAMGCSNAKEGAGKLEELFRMLDLEIPAATDIQLKVLRESVNPVRLKNHPIELTLGVIDSLYRSILKKAEE